MYSAAVLATAAVVVRPGVGRSDVIRARSAGPLRVMSPRHAGRAAWIVTSSLGGGLVDGDDVALEIDIEAGATCVVTTQASTKVYRGRTRQALTVRVHGDATALVVPDPVTPYRDAHFTQRTAIDLAPAASLVLVDMLTAGRVAHGERWDAAAIDTTLLVTRAGVPLLRDRVRLDPAGGRVAVRMRGCDALATVILLGPRFAALPATHAASHPAVLAAQSPLGDGVLHRLAGSVADVTAATRALARDACALVGEDPWARKW